MVTKTIDRTHNNNKTYNSDRTLKEEIEADENLDEWIRLVEQYSSQDTVQAYVLGVGLDDDTITITYRVPIGDVEVEERFNLPYTISDDYEINRLLRTMYGSDVSLSDAVDKLRREEEIPVKFDLEDGIQGIKIPNEKTKQHIDEIILSNCVEDTTGETELDKVLQEEDEYGQIQILKGIKYFNIAMMVVCCIAFLFLANLLIPTLCFLHILGVYLFLFD
jgi:hypothetical protein